MLAGGLRPIRRLRAPALYALGWLAVAGAAAAALATRSNLPHVGQRILAAADLQWSIAGSVLTAILAAIAAFQTSRPDRRAAWALLPVPALVLWIAASGLGCLRDWAVTAAGTHAPSFGEARTCLVFILGTSLPLCAVLAAMLRRGYPMYPELTATLGGLAAAAAAASLLTLFHPYDASALDLAIHAAAVAVVILACRALGRRTLLRGTGRDARPEQG